MSSFWFVLWFVELKELNGLATSAPVCCKEVTYSKKKKVVAVLMNALFKCLFEIDLFWLPIAETVVLLSFFPQLKIIFTGIPYT